MRPIAQTILSVIGIVLSVYGTSFSGTSANFRMTTEVLDSGGTSASSVSYRVLGKTRGHQLSSLTSAGIMLGAGFLRSAYFASITPVLAPVVTSITPNSGTNSGIVSITSLAGANFQAGAAVKLSKSGQTDINAASVAVAGTSSITCTFDITGAGTGLWDVTVTNPDGRSGTLPSAFTVSQSAPQITSITPAKGTNNGTVSITDLSGSNFSSGASVKLAKTGAPDIPGTNVVVSSAAKITCQFDLNGRIIGPWDVTVTNGDGQTATLSSGFEIESATVSIIGPVVSTENPFNPGVKPTSITYTLSRSTDVTISIFNMRGEKVWERTFPADLTGAKVGPNSIPWDGLTDYKSYVSFGVYIVIITSKSGGSTVVLGKTKIAVVK